MTRPESSSATGYSAGVVAVATGLVVASLGTYLFHAVAGRTLSTTDFGLFGSLWSAFFLVVIVAFLGLEQTITARLAKGEGAAGGKRAIGFVGAVAVVALIVIQLIAWGVLGIRDEMVLFWLALAVVGYAALYPLRGIRAGTRRFWAYGGLFAAESLVRLGVLVCLGLFHDLGLVDFVAAMALAPIIVVAANSSGYGVLAGGEDGAKVPVDLGAVGALGIANLALVAILNLGPVLVTARGTAASSALLFAALLVVRSPLYLLQSVTSTALVYFSKAVEADGTAVVWRRVARRAVIVTLAGGGIAILVSPVARWLVGAIFGSDLRLASLDYALIGIAVVGVVVALVLNQFLIAAGLESVVAAAWLAGLGVFAAVSLTGTDPLRAAEWGLVAAQTTVIVLLLVLGRIRIRAAVL